MPSSIVVQPKETAEDKLSEATVTDEESLVPSSPLEVNRTAVKTKQEQQTGVSGKKKEEPCPTCTHCHREICYKAQNPQCFDLITDPAEEEK